MRCRFLAAVATLTLAASPAAGEAPAGVIDIPVNIGQSAKDLRVPHHNAEGKLTLRLNAARAERASTSDFNFNDLRIEIFDDTQEQPALEVILQGAVFDRTSNKLSSDQHSIIRGENMEITGRRLEFDLDSRTSRLQGPVTMTVTSPATPAP
jgi:hypothetical protein